MLSDSQSNPFLQMSDNYSLTKVYDWYQKPAAIEYDEWQNSLLRLPGFNKLTFTMTEAGLERARPKKVIEFEPDPSAPKEDHQEYRKHTNEYNNKLQVYYEKCETAMGLLWNTLKFSSKASCQVEDAYKLIPVNLSTGLPSYSLEEWTPDKQFLAAFEILSEKYSPNDAADVSSKASCQVEDAYKLIPVDLSTGLPSYSLEEWTPDKQFLAAFEILSEKYSPNDAADVTTLRSNLAELDDINGFHLYSQEFIRILTALEKANARPSDNDLTEWVKKNIKSKEVRTFIATNVVTILSQSSKYDTIFQHVECFLKTLGTDLDPYKMVKSGPGNKPLTTQALMTSI